MAAAVLPAVLYFFAVWVGINAYATRFDLKGLDEADQPTGRDVVITSLFFLVPFSVLLWAMFGAGFTPQYAAALAIVAGASLLFFNADFDFRPAQIAERFQSAVMSAARQVSMIAAIILKNQVYH